MRPAQYAYLVTDAMGHWPNGPFDNGNDEEFALRDVAALVIQP